MIIKSIWGHQEGKNLSNLHQKKQIGKKCIKKEIVGEIGGGEEVYSRSY